MTTVVRDDEHEAAEYVISPELQDELLKHPGRWVAMDRVRILAVGDDPAVVLAQARQSGNAHPILYRVPDKNIGYFFGSEGVVRADPQQSSEPLSADPDDEYFIDLVRDARADALVTGDAHLLDLRAVIPVMTPAEFLQTLPDH